MDITFNMRSVSPKPRCARLTALLMAGLMLACVSHANAQIDQPQPVQVQQQASHYEAQPNLLIENTDSSAARSALSKGAQLEKDELWGEALSLYQSTLRDFPKNKALQTRRSVARIHFDLGRRYSDTSFLKSIASTDGNTAMNVYAEVLLKVQAYYVGQLWVDGS